MIKIMKIFQLMSSLLIGTTLIKPINGLEKGAKSFVMTNANAKNVIREFEYYVNVAEENIKNSIIQNKINLFDFTTISNIDNWMEISDTVREVGKSKASLVLQQTQVFQRAIFFTLLNPQPNGAGFAGVRTRTNWNLSSVKNIKITCRGQGSNENYKIVLRHNGLESNDDISYEQFFTAPMSSETFSTVTIPLDNFKPYYRGKEIIDADPLNTSNITMFGLQVYGGVYLPIKQKGVSALEIETIAATS
ncbi:uncharacterized protein LOC127280153 isoform X2 [Leptopilina boulardi]|nr:uncharacterized protein LOC127280153 isoform X2 [Leptopilina boulardi]XP_051158969.1 uncharacterized protein LOC127280153 isoform X2 [Leptopilina boulardi]XP_051158970.1 uncharacterized protein LOC127280153 isoform X2 [Leptopilina boulardi]XP_051158971.1 uncharacterized protein LOC127280153 isoform X2 [Leptopilina boulardi]